MKKIHNDTAALRERLLCVISNNYFHSFDGPLNSKLIDPEPGSNSAFTGIHGSRRTCEDFEMDCGVLLNYVQQEIP